MQYPARLSDDLKYLSKFYNWNDEDKKEVRASFERCLPMCNYYIALAAAHRAGYEQLVSNGHIRLDQWCKEKGLPSPYNEHFNPKELDAMALHNKALLS
jgi:hypothetical protein